MLSIVNSFQNSHRETDQVLAQVDASVLMSAAKEVKRNLIDACKSLIWLMEIEMDSMLSVKL